MQSIRGKKALITGAASGLGREIALRLARQGADIFLLDVEQEKLAEVVAEALDYGVAVIGRYCDVTSRDDLQAAAREVLEKWGTLDILVNNAGVGYYGPTHKMTIEQWEKLLAINLHAPIFLTQELLPTLLQRPEAHVLNMASICGLVAGGRFNAYHVSKFGLVGFSESLRAEYGRAGLGVTALCPGPVITNLYEAADCGHSHKQTPTPPAWICTTPERVADRAIAAIRHDKGLVLVGWLAYVLYYLKRIAPWLLDITHRIGRRKKMKKKAARLLQQQQTTLEFSAGSEELPAAAEQDSAGDSQTQQAA